MKKLIIIWLFVIQPFCSAQNLLINGDFEQGNIFFFSDYKYDADSGAPEGNYKVDSNSLNWWSVDDINCYDHTTDRSNMMYINGAEIPNQRIWYQTIDVNLNETYTFSIWLVNLLKVAPAELNVFINDYLIGTIEQTNVIPCEWKNYSFDWKATATKATISLIDKNIDPMGNDFGIDDLSLIEKLIISKSTIYFPDTVSQVGVENFKIPLKVKLYDKTLTFENLSYTTSIKFNSCVFLTTGVTNGTILKDSIDNSNYRNITIYCDSVNINDTNKVLTELVGTVLLGDSLTPLDIIDFRWHSPKLEVVAFTDGSLLARACALQLRQIQLFNPIKLQIQPNPANDDIEVIIDGDELGYFTLNLYDLQGMKIDEIIWKRNQKDKESFKLPLDNYSNGLYTVILRTPWNVISKPLMIVK